MADVELAHDARTVVDRGRRTSAIAIAVLPIGLSLITLIAGLADRPRWDDVGRAFGFTGLMLNGPFLRLAVETRGSWSPWVWVIVPWLLVVAWIVAALRTRVGDLHPILCFAMILIWMACGFLSMPMV